MKKLVGIALATIGGILGTIGTTGCIVFMFDEPVYPESLD